MKTVTQIMLYRQALIKYSLKYGVTKAAIRYKTNRQYDSGLKALAMISPASAAAPSDEGT